MFVSKQIQRNICRVRISRVICFAAGCELFQSIQKWRWQGIARNDASEILSIFQPKSQFIRPAISKVRISFDSYITENWIELHTTKKIIYQTHTNVGWILRIKWQHTEKSGLVSAISFNSFTCDTSSNIFVNTEWVLEKLCCPCLWKFDKNLLR